MVFVLDSNPRIRLCPVFIMPLSTLNTILNDINIALQNIQSNLVSLINQDAYNYPVISKNKHYAALTKINKMYVELRKTSPSQVWYKETLIKNALDYIYLLYEVDGVRDIPETVLNNIRPYFSDILQNTVGRTVAMTPKSYTVHARPPASQGLKAAATETVTATIKTSTLSETEKTTLEMSIETAINAVELSEDETITTKKTSILSATATAVDMDASLSEDQKTAIKTAIETAISASEAFAEPPADQNPEDQDNEQR